MNVCTTATQIYDYVPIARMRNSDSGGKILKEAAVVLMASATTIRFKIGIVCEREVALSIATQYHNVALIEVIARMNKIAHNRRFENLILCDVQAVEDTRLARHVQSDDAATAVALSLCKQVVVPFTICMCAQVRGFHSVSANDADVAPLACALINRVELVDVAVDLLDCRLPRDAPLLAEVSDVRDVFVRALMMRLVDARYVILCHVCLSFTVDCPLFILLRDNPFY